MTTVSSLRVTLDTNVCDIIHAPDKAPGLVDPICARALRQAIADGKILAFVAEATLFVECLEFKDKLAYLAVSGTQAPRPSPDPRVIARFRDLGALGVKILRAPLLAGEIFVSELNYADDAIFTAAERQIRFGEFTRRYPGRKPIISLGQKLLDGQRPVPAGRHVRTGPTSTHSELPQDWAIAIKREWDSAAKVNQKALRKQVGHLIGEWCDTLIVGAHYGYGNDLFCTTDEGRSFGADSILFHGNRSKLKESRIDILSPTELVRKIY